MRSSRFDEVVGEEGEEEVVVVVMRAPGASGAREVLAEKRRLEKYLERVALGKKMGRERGKRRRKKEKENKDSS